MTSLSQNSKRTYSSGEKHFMNFCGLLKKNPSQALPANESTLIYFAVYLSILWLPPHISEFTCSSRFNPNLHLAVSDIKFFPSFTSPHDMTVEMKASKTYPFRKGMTLVISKISQVTCPVNCNEKVLRHNPRIL